MKQDAIKKLATACGAVHYILNRYKEKEINGHDGNYIFSILGLPKGTIYCIEYDKVGFVFTTRSLKLKYTHDDLFNERVVEVSGMIDGVLVF